MTKNETFGEYIHALRRQADMTLTKLAAALDLDQSTLSKIENNKRKVPEEVLPKLAAVFGINIGDLEKEYYSERIAELLYRSTQAKQVLKLAEQKLRYLSASNIAIQSK